VIAVKNNNKMQPICSIVHPKLTVVTPSLNQAATLEKTIISLLEQGYPDLEYIIMDGGSVDGSLDIIRKYEKYLTYWQSQPDAGQVHALNAGFLKSKGEICTWLNADDFLYPGALREAASQFLKHPEVELIFGYALYLNEEGLPFMKLTPFMADLESLAVTDYLHQPSVFFTKRILEKVGFLNTAYINAFDYELWIKIFKKSGYRYVPFLFSASIVSKKTKTWGNWRLTLEEMIKIQKAHFGAASLDTQINLAACKNFEYVPNFSQGPIPSLAKFLGWVRFIGSGALKPISLLKHVGYALETRRTQKAGFINWRPL